MGNIKIKRKVLTLEEIDSAVIAQTEDDSCWEKPVKVMKSKSTSLALPSALASRAAFFPACIARPIWRNGLSV